MSLHDRLSVGRALGRLHERLARDAPEVDRVAVAVLDRRATRVRTFVHSTRGPSPLDGYEMPLEEVPSLLELARHPVDRIIDDLEVLSGSPGRHTRRMLESGFRSSFTRPLLLDGEVAGFVFLDSQRKQAFDPATVERLEMFLSAVELLVRSRLLVGQVLRSSLGVATSLARLRDGETGAHLERMARYSRIVAVALGAGAGFDDELAEFLFLFAPLHDIGKIGVPDRILLKEGPLDASEQAEMRRHVETGAEVVGAILRETHGSALPYASMLHNVVRHHHEAVDGSGYPDGLAGDDIPIEARIVTVADVFDALTTSRPYKEAWPVDRAFEHLLRESGRRFDTDCVHTLVARRAAVEEVMRSFSELRPAGPMNDVPEAWAS